MTIRQIIILAAGAAIIAGGFLLNNVLSGMKEAPKQAEEGSSAKFVRAKRVENGSIPTYVSVTGKITAEKKIDIFSEVQGVLVGGARPFKEGNAFRKGELLLRIKNDDVRMNLLSQKSSFLSAITGILPDWKLDFPASFGKWEAYLRNFDIEKGSIPELPAPESEKERIFLASRNILNQYYAIKSSEETLSKYTIYAPFDGVITESNIDLGAVVRPQQPLGEFISTAAYELEAATYLDDLNDVTVGDTVELESPDVPGYWLGEVSRISNKIDQTTQTVRVFITTAGKDLKEGMYLKGRILTGAMKDAYKVEKGLVEQGNRLYVIRDSLLYLQPVEIMASVNGSVIVKGLKDGEVILSEPIVDAHDSMKVIPALPESSIGRSFETTTASNPDNNASSTN